LCLMRCELPKKATKDFKGLLGYLVEAAEMS
jgi:hypothetical protein